jgi:LysM repeat protein
MMVSVSKRHWMIWLVILSLVLVACERPFASDSNAPPTPDSGGVITEPGEVITTPVVEVTPETSETPSGETGVGEGEGTGEGETGDTGEPTTGETSGEGETTEEPSGETPAEEAPTGETTGEGTDEEVGGGVLAEQTGEETTPTEETATQEQTTTPTVHVVVAGDTLYKIGLRYGVSWVTLAQYNNLSNPNRLTVGQQIRIPGAGENPGPTPSPQTEEIYVVKAGDNLYRIGLAYGISWVQIAEANGIVNPNYLIVGQRIKIPMSAPGPSPQFSHTVRRGQTLFSISLQYGVSWTAIAEGNNIVSPYVIFPGQVLVIPGG